MTRLMRLLRGPVKLFGTQPPKGDSGRHGLAVAAVVRNEATHLREWLRFHEYAGVRAFFLYDDGSTDDTAAVAYAACQQAEVTVFPWDFRTADARSGRGLHVQALALAHAVSNFGGQFRWMATIDPDEFLVPLQHLSVETALGTLEDHPVISLPWVMFGRNGHATPPLGGVLRNYLKRARDLKLNAAPGVWNTKPVFDPARITGVHVHRMRADHGLWTANDQGERYRVFTAPRPSKQSNALLQLNHYYTRSDAELQEKLAKGGSFTDHAPYRSDIILGRVAAIEADQVEDRAVLEFIARKDAATGRDFFSEMS